LAQVVEGQNLAGGGPTIAQPRRTPPSVFLGGFFGVGRCALNQIMQCRRIAARVSNWLTYETAAKPLKVGIVPAFRRCALI